MITTKEIILSFLDLRSISASLCAWSAEYEYADVSVLLPNDLQNPMTFQSFLRVINAVSIKITLEKEIVNLFEGGGERRLILNWDQNRKVFCF